MTSASTQKGGGKGPDVVQGTATISDDNWRESFFIYGSRPGCGQEPMAGVSFPLHSYIKAPNCQNSRRWDFRATGSCMLHHAVTRTAVASLLIKVCTEFVEYCGPKRPQYHVCIHGRA